MRRTLHALVGVSLMLSSLALVLSPTPPAAAQTAGQTKPVEVTVTKVRCATDCRNTGLEAAGESAADFYGIIRINGVAQTTRRAAPDQELVEVKWPDLGGVWVESVDVPWNQTTVPVSIEIWDHDGSSGDDLGDASPIGGRAALEFQFDTLTGALSGDITSPAACATGNGEPGGSGPFGAGPKPPVEVCVAVNADRDGDGLFDSWETGGIDVNRDETVDLPLHQAPYNADPLRKDLFVESDFMADATHSHAPAAGALQDVVDAFAAAPVSTPLGGMTKPGIALHAMLDEQIPEVASFRLDSVGPGANDDFNDFKLGAPSNACDGRFGTAADRGSPNCANILAAKKLVFRYSIFGHAHTEAPTSSGRAELDDRGSNDFIVTLGALSPATINAVGGQQAADAGTYMHELGHTLALRHGGFEDTNCKPNYRSVMNYTLQFPNNDPNRPLDYSAVPLDALEEDSTGAKPGLDENKGIGGPAGQLAIYGRGGNLRTAPADGRIDWNGNTLFETDVSADVNFINTIGPAPMNGGCAGPTPNENLRSYDDWNHIVYSFWNSRFFADGAHPTAVTELTEETLVLMNTGTDLQIGLSDAPDPVAAGTDLTYSVTVSNLGGKPAQAVDVVDTLPSGVKYRSSTADCGDTGGVVTCRLGTIPAGENRSFTLTVGIPADLVYENGGPKQLTNRVEVRSPESPDPVGDNNTATETTMVIAVADVRIAQATATTPLEMLVGESAPASLAVTVENGGPSTPIDTVVTTTVTAEPGVVASPATTTSDVAALATGSPRTLTSALTVECRTPGVRTVTVETGVVLKHTADVDPDPADNRRSVSFQVDCVVPIAINVRPGGSPNSVNLNTDATVAALTTQAGEYGLPVDVDATAIDGSSVLWGLRVNLLDVAAPTGARESHGSGHPERSYELDETTVDPDTDLVLHFRPSDSGLTAATTEGCLKGRLRGPDGRMYTVFGCDSVRVVPPRS